MYEIALVEWHLTPEYINRSWTEELLTLMFIKRKVRLDKLRKSIPKSTGEPPVSSNRIADAQFFKDLKIPYRRV